MSQSPNPGAACKNWKDRGLSKAEQDEIVNKHNQLRQRVASGKETRGKNGRQPPAAYMPNLVRIHMSHIVLIHDLTRAERILRANRLDYTTIYHI